jgi:hypothetical protein
MNRVLIVGVLGVLFLGLGLVGTNLTNPSLLGESPGFTPSMRQLSEESAQLDDLNHRIACRLKMKQELLRLWESGSIGSEAMLDHWVWLNSQKPDFSNSTKIMYPGMSSRQVAMLQILSELEESTKETASCENLEHALMKFSIARQAIYTGSLPIFSSN